MAVQLHFQPQSDIFVSAVARLVSFDRLRQALIVCPAGGGFMMASMGMHFYIFL